MFNNLSCAVFLYSVVSLYAAFCLVMSNFSCSWNELDFENIKQVAKEAQKKLLLNKTSDTLTSAEKKSIPVYMNDIVSYVKKYAKQGKFKFEYDCKNLSNTCFFELATQFKQKNPLFFVMTDNHMKVLIVEWTGKNEVWKKNKDHKLVI